MRKYRYWIFLAMILYGFLELFSYTALYLLDKHYHIAYEPIDLLSARHRNIIDKFVKEEAGYVSFDPSLGWSIKENGSSELYRANSSGIRGNREYALTPPRGARRISTFGDSHTHCDEVKNNETWQAVMESSDPNMEVINFGVGGYGTDQAYLRYLEQGDKYNSHIVLIGFMSGNIYRNVNTFRPFHYPPTGLPLAKPRFIINDGKLSLIPNRMLELDDYRKLLSSPQQKLSELGANDWYYNRSYKSSMPDWSPTVRLAKISMQKVIKKLSNENIIEDSQYNTDSEAFKITTKIFDEFYSASLKNNSIPVILISHNRGDLIRYHRDKTKRYAPLLEYLDSRGYRYIDLMNAVKGEEANKVFSKAHYSPLGNKMAAKYILRFLNDMEIQKGR